MFNSIGGIFQCSFCGKRVKMYFLDPGRPVKRWKLKFLGLVNDISVSQKGLSRTLAYLALHSEHPLFLSWMQQLVIWYPSVLDTILIWGSVVFSWNYILVRKWWWGSYPANIPSYLRIKSHFIYLNPSVLVLPVIYLVCGLWTMQRVKRWSLC